mmetsp:Transcript_18/g.96  ORF Transcript_18/g.96 Transcript_18/m.96 type:complete len:736 (-) Transcript_18:3050-5257(-)|eukprot:CAMPEP_0168782240 /NCGR_PEP_ID=MMETSP0725-20121227/9062_1 /TAXON_ID=265536 /ORGANISM="Amphiprora sp., Strain CCMP467" /LENGTH=735 /DNA_ID=CAMNT_0008832167 /DNA_START=73 /DNA_END=2280 /DNA_ORIENTATION=-
MDISILASVGSFVVSERVLKPKASVLVILGCFLAYDLTTKTHDSSSLRVYRGPALIAFTLIMTAFSLRTWRRNGVACDELIFLPGTPHGVRHGADMAANNSNSNTPARNAPASSGSPGQSRSRSPGRTRNGEADVAAGVAPQRSSVEMSPVRNPQEQQVRSRSSSRDMDLPETPMSHDFAYSWDDNDGEGHDQDIDDDEEVALSPGGNNNMPSQAQIRDSLRGSSVDGSTVSGNNSDDNSPHIFREARPRITRIGSFFFFRSNTTSTHNAAYAPSGPSVVGAAIDLSMPTLFNFHLFIEAYNHIDEYGSETPAKILPLIFLSVLIVRTMFPPGRRGRFWSVMKYTFMAPFHHVRFRDAFMGDILTSLVRPLQDILFALSYYVTVIWGTASGNLSLSESGDALESSWLLHNVVLPSCALLPLWWKFLQTLRQSYDSGNRWPHLGNAFKYLSAALVILYGMTHPENRRSSVWIVMFVGSIMYQIWWDVVMDWDLLVIVPRGDNESLGLETAWCTSRSSFRANSYVLYLNMLIVQPLKDATRWLFTKIPRLSQVQLRPRRLYKEPSFYWRILTYNVAFRFCWMLCFIPAYRLSPSGREHVTTFSSDTNSYVGVLLPVAEILRRTFWGFLLLEKETLRMQEGNPSYAQLCRTTDEEVEELMSSLDNDDDNSDDSKVRGLPAWLGTSTQQQHLQLDSANGRLASIHDYLTLSDDMIHKLFIAELSMWAAAFVGFGLWATT